jgi:hypothetical protein
MSFKVFDTEFGVQGMENVGEIWYCLVPFLTQRGLSCALVLVASNRVVFSLMTSLKKSHVELTTNIAYSSMALCSE